MKKKPISRAFCFKYPLKSKFHFMGDHCPRLSHKVFTTLQSIHTKKESKNSHFSIYT